MTRKELIKRIGELEWEDFEAKEAKGEVPKSCWPTVSAFANTTGGWLLFGIKQVNAQFELQGISNPEKIEQDFLNTLRGEKFNAFIDTKQVKFNIEGKIILGFYIPPSSQKPVYFNSLANTFIRRGSADQRATRPEIDAMYRDQSFGTKTGELAPGTSSADLKEKSIREYKSYMSNFNPEVSYNRMEPGEMLVKLRILDKETGQCTFGGLLFFGKRDSIEQFFADFRIDLLEVPGKSYEDAPSRYTFRLSEDDYENLWEAYFECIKRLRKEVDVEFKLSAEGFGEERSPGLKAAREALVNMLMHADYFSPAHPRIRIFTNHIEYYNPGGLPKPLEELKGKDLSIPRNPIIAKLFRMVKMAENAGYGLDKMEENWKAYNNTAPIFDTSFDSTIVKLFTASVDGPDVGKEAGERRDDTGRTPESIRQELQSLLEQLGENAEENIELLRSKYGVFTAYLQGNNPTASERLRRDLGITSEKELTQEQERIFQTLLLLFLNIHSTANEMANSLNTSERSIRRVIKNLVDKNIIQRQGSRKTGHWLIVEN